MRPIIADSIKIVSSLGALIGGWYTIAPPPKEATTAATGLVLVAIYLLIAGGPYAQKVADSRYWLRRARIWFAVGVCAFVPYLVAHAWLVFEYPESGEMVRGPWVTSELAMQMSGQQQTLSPKDILAAMGGPAYYSEVWSPTSLLASYSILWALYLASVAGICASIFFVAEGVFPKKPPAQVEPL